MDKAQRDAIALLTRQLRHLPEESLRQLAAAGPLTVAMVARAVLDLRPAAEPDDEAWIRAVFPQRATVGRPQRPVPIPIAGNRPASTTGGTVSTTEENMALVRAQLEKVGQAVAAVTQAHDLLHDAAGHILAVSGNLPGPNRAAAACVSTASRLEEIQGEVMRLNEIIETAANNPNA